MGISLSVKIHYSVASEDDTTGQEDGGNDGSWYGSGEDCVASGVSY